MSMIEVTDGRLVDVYDSMGNSILDTLSEDTISEMQRLLDVPGEVPDWAHQLYSSYLEKRLIKGVNSGLTSNLKGPSPILGLSYGVGFSDKKGSYDYDADDDHEFEFVEDD